MTFESVALLVLVFILINLHKVLTQTVQDGRPLVQSTVGNIRGLQAEDGDYSMFLGIPYAQVDESNPFGPSKPYPLFKETFDAIDDSAICPQIEEFNQTIVGTLDCLHLNIYVPNTANTNPLPVMVWIYGGGFSIGFAGRFLYGPSFLVRHDIILITINYRLGPYGFMCLDIPEVPGNQGLKDQLIALRWIIKNIAAFGGDPTRITISGNSSGGTSCDFHLYYGHEKLFHRITPQSGVATTNSVREPDPTSAIILAEYFNYVATDLNDAISFLATKTPHEIIARSNEAGLSYGACLEKEFDDVERFITAYPINLNATRANEIDILVGYNNDEAYVMYAEVDEQTLANIDVIGNALNSNFIFDHQEVFEEMKKVVINFYFGDDNVTEESRQTVMDAHADFTFNHPTMRAVEKYLEGGAENLYLYLFSYAGGRNFVKHRNNLTGGAAAHADEYGYQFDISYMEKPLDPEDQLIVDRMTELWTNFVKYGNPTPTATELVPLQWPRVTRDKWHYMEINTELRVGTRPMHDRMAFLDLFYKINEKYRPGFGQAPSAGVKIVLDISLLLLAVFYV